MDPFDQGRNAAATGDRNPFPVGTDEWSNWLDGYLSAAKENDDRSGEVRPALASEVAIN